MSDVSIQDLLTGKVRLVFGDKGQLEAIKLHEKMKETAAKICQACDGEGSVICEACDGTGEKK